MWVLDPEVQGKAAQGYLWVYTQSGGDVLFEFGSSRKLEVPKTFLARFRGTIQSDAYQSMMLWWKGTQRSNGLAVGRM